MHTLVCSLPFVLPNRFSRRSWRTRRTSRSRLVFRHSKCDTARNNPRPAYSSNARSSNTNDNVKLFDVRIAASSISFCRDFASSRRHRPPHRTRPNFSFLTLVCEQFSKGTKIPQHAQNKYLASLELAPTSYVPLLKATFAQACAVSTDLCTCQFSNSNEHEAPTATP